MFELYSALAWGMVMYLFREKRDRLHGGMVSSMQVSLASQSCRGERKPSCLGITQMPVSLSYFIDTDVLYSP